MEYLFDVTNKTTDIESLSYRIGRLNLDVGLESIVRENNELKIKLSEEPQDSTSFLGLVNNHDGEPMPIAKVYSFAPDEIDKPVQALNFRKELNTRLHNKKTWTFGRLLKEEFYPFGEDLRTVDYNNLIISVSYDYEFNPVTNEAVYRLERIKWFDSEGGVSVEKILPKNYTGHEGMREAKTRRSNIIDSLKHDLDTFSKSGETDNSALVAQLIGQLNEYIHLYVEYGSFALVDVIGTLVNPILDGELAPGLTVRSFMIGKIDFLQVEQASVNLYKGSLL